MSEWLFILTFVAGSLYTPLIYLIISLLYGKTYKDCLIEKLNSDIEFLNKTLLTKEEIISALNTQKEAIEVKLLKLLER